MMQWRWIGIAVSAIVSLTACGSAHEGPIDASVPSDGSTPNDSAVHGDAGTESCDAPTALLDLAAQVAGGSESCRTWADAVRGRVVVNSFASAVVWTTRTPSELNVGVMVSAVHVLGSGWFHDDGTGPGDDVPEELRAPLADELGVMRVRAPEASGALDRRFVSPQWIVYNPAIPASEHEDVTTILPRHDVFVGLVDGHREEEGLVAPLSPTFGERAALTIHDPRGRAEDEQTFADAAPGSLAMLIGYPQAGPDGGAFSIGRVLSDDDARAAIAWLAAQGDEEGSIAYEPEVEAIVEGEAVPGMSGGGAFDHEGRLVGILVRASDPEAERRYVRVVRMRYVAALLTAARASLDATARSAVDPFLPILAP